MVNSLCFVFRPPKIFHEPVIFLGTGVTHSRPRDKSSPSIGAVSLIPCFVLNLDGSSLIEFFLTIFIIDSFFYADIFPQSTFPKSWCANFVIIKLEQGVAVKVI